MASGSIPFEQSGKRGIHVTDSSNAFAGQGAWIYFRDDTVVTDLEIPKHTGAALTGSWPAGSWLVTPLTGLTVSSGLAIVGKADV